MSSAGHKHPLLIIQNSLFEEEAQKQDYITELRQKSLFQFSIPIVTLKRSALAEPLTNGERSTGGP